MPVHDVPSFVDFGQVQLFGNLRLSSGDYFCLKLQETDEPFSSFTGFLYSYKMLGTLPWMLNKKLALGLQTIDKVQLGEEVDHRKACRDCRQKVHPSNP